MAQPPKLDLSISTWDWTPFTGASNPFPEPLSAPTASRPPTPSPMDVDFTEEEEAYLNALVEKKE
jgi:hypothetical protein